MTKQVGFAIWLTGLPASGKSTLAAGLSDALTGQGIRIQILDSDDLRQVLTPEPTYSQSEREWFYQVMVHIGQLLVQNGVNVIFSATANRRRYRNQARQAIEQFAEVYVRCSLETCMERDTKGIYAKAQAGEAQTVPGVQVPYEAPQTPGLTIDTEQTTPEEGVSLLLSWLEEFISGRVVSNSEKM